MGLPIFHPAPVELPEDDPSEDDLEPAPVSLPYDGHRCRTARGPSSCGRHIAMSVSPWGVESYPPGRTKAAATSSSGKNMGWGSGRDWRCPSTTSNRENPTRE
jgi:hypothetical protein